MATRAPFKIELGGEEFKIRPLTIRQLQEVEAILFSAGEGKKTNLEIGAAIILAALKRDHAALTEDDLEANVHEIGKAVKIITDEAGFVRAAPGEAEAA